MKLILPLIASLVAFHSSLAAAAAKPNIIVIMADDMGFSDLGCYGGEIADAESRRAREGRRAIHAVLQHGPLLPDARVAAHGAVSASGGHRPHDG